MNAYLKDQSDVDEKDYDEWLDSIDGKIHVAGMTFYASDILKNCDSIAYECGKSDYADGLDDVWICDECGEEYDSEDKAEDCCKIECPTCGELYETQEEADECCKEEESEDDDEDDS